LVAMPTAIPLAPLTRSKGTLAGSTLGSSCMHSIQADRTIRGKINSNLIATMTSTGASAVAW
jgi:hypothetical protein